MRIRHAIAGGVAVLGVALATTLTGVAQAEPSQSIEAQSPAALIEMKTHSNAGWFYTTSPQEAATAARDNGFTDQVGIGRIDTAPSEDSQEVHRLRLKEGGPSYMLSISPQEWNDPRFVDEGVTGYLSTTEGAGQDTLLRFSKDNQWRVLTDEPANVEQMKADGYSVDGPLGSFRP